MSPRSLAIYFQLNLFLKSHQKPPCDVLQKIRADVVDFANPSEPIVPKSQWHVLFEHHPIPSFLYFMYGLFSRVLIWPSGSQNMILDLVPSNCQHKFCLRASLYSCPVKRQMLWSANVAHELRERVTHVIAIDLLDGIRDFKATFVRVSL